MPQPIVPGHSPSVDGQLIHSSLLPRINAVLGPLHGQRQKKKQIIGGEGTRAFIVFGIGPDHASVAGKRSTCPPGLFAWAYIPYGTSYCQILWVRSVELVLFEVLSRLCFRLRQQFIILILRFGDQRSRKWLRTSRSLVLELRFGFSPLFVTLSRGLSSRRGEIPRLILLLLSKSFHKCNPFFVSSISLFLS